MLTNRVFPLSDSPPKDEDHGGIFIPGEFIPFKEKS